MSPVSPQSEINSVIALFSSGQFQEALDKLTILTKAYPNDHYSTILLVLAMLV